MISSQVPRGRKVENCCSRGPMNMLRRKCSSGFHGSRAATYLHLYLGTQGNQAGAGQEQSDTATQGSGNNLGRGVLELVFPCSYHSKESSEQGVGEAIC